MYAVMADILDISRQIRLTKATTAPNFALSAVGFPTALLFGYFKN
jgi:hypothetical protein